LAASSNEASVPYPALGSGVHLSADQTGAKDHGSKTTGAVEIEVEGDCAADADRERCHSAHPHIHATVFIVSDQNTSRKPWTLTN